MQNQKVALKTTMHTAINRKKCNENLESKASKNFVAVEPTWELEE